MYIGRSSGRRDMNFVALESKAQNRGNGLYLAAFLLVVFLMAAVCGGYGSLRWKARQLAHKTDEAVQRMETLRTGATGKQIGQMRRTQTFCQNAHAATDMLERMTAVDVTGEMALLAEQMAGNTVSVEKITGKQGRLVLEVRTSDYREASLYVERLKQSGLFSDVLYEGFVKADNGYRFSVECEAAGQEEQDETQ